jgi:hypothetical protein
MTTDILCPDCGVRVGQRHLIGCDVSRCKKTGSQLLSCTLLHAGPCEPCIWTGTWPAEAFARSQGWVFGPDLPDLNKVYIEESKGNVVWDPAREDFKLREDAERDEARS